MNKVLPSLSPSPSVAQTIVTKHKRNSTTSPYLLIQARCKVSVGDVCTVDFPTHDDPDSYAFHLNCHNESAVITAVRKSESINVRMTSGGRKGKVQKDINPGILIFPGRYVKE